MAETLIQVNWIEDRFVVGKKYKIVRRIGNRMGDEYQMDRHYWDMLEGEEFIARDLYTDISDGTNNRYHQRHARATWLNKGVEQLVRIGKISANQYIPRSCCEEVV